MKVTDITQALGDALQQLWVRARVLAYSSCRAPITILLDTGAGGDNYESSKFWKRHQQGDQHGDATWGCRMEPAA